MPVVRFVLTVIGGIAIMIGSASVISSSGGLSPLASTSPEAVTITNPTSFGESILVVNEFVVLLALLIFFVALIGVMGVVIAFIFGRIATTTSGVVNNAKSSRRVSAAP